MNNLINSRLSELTRLCERHHIRTLYLFGSATTSDAKNSRFGPESDIDFLVAFNSDIDLYDYFDNYLALKDALQALFGRSVDLLEEQTIKNPILRQSIDKNKRLIYGRAS